MHRCLRPCWFMTFFEFPAAICNVRHSSHVSVGCYFFSIFFSIIPCIKRYQTIIRLRIRICALCTVYSHCAHRKHSKLRHDNRVVMIVIKRLTAKLVKNWNHLCSSEFHSCQQRLLIHCNDNALMTKMHLACHWTWVESRFTCFTES